MRQIIYTVRCLSVALVLVAAFATLSSVQEASAASKEQVEKACEDAQGEFYEIPVYDPADPLGDPAYYAYGCWLTASGSEIHCEDFGLGASNPCFPNLPPEPEDNVGELPPGPSHELGGEIVDQAQNSPAPSAPTGNSRSGFETKMAGQ